MRVFLSRIALITAIAGGALAGIAGPAHATSTYCAGLKAQYTSDFNMYLKYNTLRLTSTDPGLRLFYGSLASRYFTSYQQGLAAYQATC